MVWIKADQKLRGHPKLRKAARLLGIAEAEMLGRLLFLWWWALDYAEDGDLSEFDVEEIEDALDWSGEGDIIHALLSCGQQGQPGLLERTADGRLVLGDWDELVGSLLERRRLDAERKRVARQRANSAPLAGHPQDILGTSAGRMTPSGVKSREEIEESRTEPEQSSISLAKSNHHHHDHDDDDDAKTIRAAYAEANIKLTPAHFELHI